MMGDHDVTPAGNDGQGAIVPPATPPAPEQPARLAAERIVIEAYDVVLRRWPDPIGLANFTQSLLANGHDEASLTRELYRSAEAKSLPTALLDRGNAYHRMVALSGLFDAARAGRLSAYVGIAGRLDAGRLVEQVLETGIEEAVLLYMDTLGTPRARKA